MSGNLLFIDTETTGLCDAKLRPDDARQPHVVEVGAILTNGRGEILGQLESMVRPEDWEIPPEAERIHGITTAQCASAGVPIGAIVAMIECMAQGCDRIIAHNATFDRQMMHIEAARLKIPSILQGKSWFCTMDAATNRCKIPGWRGGWKWPTVGEAYRHFFGEEIEGAHAAMVDVEACMKIYFEIVPREVREVIA